METLPSALLLWTCGESMEEDGNSGSQGSGFTETGLQGRSDSLCLLPRGGQPDPAAEVGGRKREPTPQRAEGSEERKFCPGSLVNITWPCDG